VGNTVEVSRIDLKFESYRMKSASRERILLSSISERGIEEPLFGVCFSPDEREVVLLDGFKRFRCALRLGFSAVPFVSMARDEATGIIQLIRASNAKSLSFIEQAKLVEELKRVYGLSVADIATQLGRSKSWVVVRVEAFSSMSESVQAEIFSGRFPLYSYLYTLRQRTRLNGVKSEDIDTFVNSVAGKGVSTRDIELLARAYFQGGTLIREQIQNGYIGFCLSQLKEMTGHGNELREVERNVLRDLEIINRVMGRLTLRLSNPKLESREFFAEAEFLVSGIMRLEPRFNVAIREFYARCRPQTCDLSAAQ
jgi:ParB/RepB/Spo0J family partition protein